MSFDVETRCPDCGTRNDVVTALRREQQPQPEDRALCWYCGTVSVFTAAGTLREPTAEELRQIESDELIQQARRRILARRGAPWS